MAISVLSYRGLFLDIVHMKPSAREVVMTPDNTDQVWTHWRLNLECVYNPGATSYAAAIGIPASQKGIMPPLTDLAIREWLEQPRGSLKLGTVDGTVWLESPRVGQTCDANNGPVLKVNGITHMAGIRKWGISLTIETWVAPLKRVIHATQPTILANRWEMSLDTDSNHTGTRIIDIVTVFNAARLRERGINAESLREEFAVFRCPDFFQRQSVQIKVLGQGNVVQTRIVDRERTVGLLNSGPATELLVRQANWTWRGSVGAALAQAQQNMPGLGQLATSQGLSQIFSAGIAAARNNLPKYYQRISVEAKGDRRAEHNRTQLLIMAMGIAVKRIGAPNAFGVTASECLIQQNLHEHWCQVDLTHRWGDDTVVGANIASGGLSNLILDNAPATFTQAFAGWAKSVDQGEAVESVGPGGGAYTILGPNMNTAPPFYRSGNGVDANAAVMGTYQRDTLESIFAQALGFEPGQNVTTPTNPNP